MGNSPHRLPVIINAIRANSIFPEQHKTVCSERSDGRYLSTYGVVHAMLKDTKPLYAFRHDFTRQEFAEWQKEVRTAMIEIMHHPHITGQPIPVCIEKIQKDGYRQEKWEFYPLPHCVSTFYILIPDKVKIPVLPYSAFPDRV